ncbi:MAG: hypothetical protein R2795_16400 [Saprospiraceae bacterium]
MLLLLKPSGVDVITAFIVKKIIAFGWRLRANLQHICNSMETLQLDHYKVVIGEIGAAHVAWLEEQRFAGLAVLVDTMIAELCWPLLHLWLASFNLLPPHPGW